MAALGGLLGTSAALGVLLGSGVVARILALVGVLAVGAAATPRFVGIELIVGIAAACALLTSIAAWAQDRGAEPRPAPGAAATEDATSTDDLKRDRPPILLMVSSLATTALWGLIWASWGDNAATSPYLEVAIAVVVGLVVAHPGAGAAAAFIAGAVTAGGHRGTIATTTVLAGTACGALGFFVPVAGYGVVVGVTVAWLRLRRRSRAKYKGLRILA